jgi:hypothetical protein
VATEIVDLFGAELAGVEAVLEGVVVTEGAPPLFFGGRGSVMVSFRRINVLYINYNNRNGEIQAVKTGSFLR